MAFKRTGGSWGKIIEVNNVKEITVAAGSIVGSAISVTSFTPDIIYNHIHVDATTLNQTVILTLPTNDFITVVGSSEFVYDGFDHDVEIKLHYSSVAPTSGSLIMRSW